LEKNKKNMIKQCQKNLQFGDMKLHQMFKLFARIQRKKTSEELSAKKTKSMF